MANGKSVTLSTHYIVLVPLSMLDWAQICTVTCIFNAFVQHCTLPNIDSTLKCIGTLCRVPTHRSWFLCFNPLSIMVALWRPIIAGFILIISSANPSLLYTHFFLHHPCLQVNTPALLTAICITLHAHYTGERLSGKAKPLVNIK